MLGKVKYFIAISFICLKVEFELNKIKEKKRKERSGLMWSIKKRRRKVQSTANRKMNENSPLLKNSTINSDDVVPLFIKNSNFNRYIF